MLYDCSFRSYRRFKELEKIKQENIKHNVHRWSVAAKKHGRVGATKDEDGDKREIRKANMRKVMRIFAKTPVALAAFYRARKGKKIIAPKKNLSFSENFFHMCFGKVPNKDIVKAFDVSLILYAEHSFNVSTFTARTITCLLYTSPSPRDKRQSRMPSSA